MKDDMVKLNIIRMVNCFVIKNDWTSFVIHTILSVIRTDIYTNMSIIWPSYESKAYVDTSAIGYKQSFSTSQTYH